MKYFSRILELSKKNRKKFIMGLVLAFLKDFSFLFIFVALNYVFRQFEKIDTGVILHAFLILLCGVVYHFAVGYLQNRLLSAQGYVIFKKYRLDAGYRLKKAPMGYFNEQRLGNIQGALTSTIASLENYMVMTLTDIINGFSIAAILTIYFFVFDVKLGAMMSVLLVILGFLLNSMYKVANKYVPLQHQIDYDMNFAVIDMIRGNSVLKIFPVKEDHKFRSAIKDRAFEIYENKRRVDIQCEVDFSIRAKLYGFVIGVSSILLIIMTIHLYKADLTFVLYSSLDIYPKQGASH